MKCCPKGFLLDHALGYLL